MKKGTTAFLFSAATIQGGVMGVLTLRFKETHLALGSAGLMIVGALIPLFGTWAPGVLSAGLLSHSIPMWVAYSIR